MAYKALQRAGLAFDLIRAEELKKDRLKNYAMLFVPGGWSSNKMKALGEKGVDSVKRFIHEGGSYLGFCGGAGLATLDGIGLLNIRRKPTRDRVPSFSGRIMLKTSEHPVWRGIREPVFHAWWPPQFVIHDDSVKVLAAYQEALPDSFSSDLNTGDVANSGGWTQFERLYQINLDPTRLMNDPAVIEGTYGKGKVLLSLVHFDTVNDKNGMNMLKNLWKYLAPGNRRNSSEDHGRTVRKGGNFAVSPCVSPIADLVSAIDGLIDLGSRNFLWFWRNPMLLQWRRGVRGIEYCTLYIMIREIEDRLRRLPSLPNPDIEGRLKGISSRLLSFTERAGRLLVLERLAMQNGPITYERCDDPEIQKMRSELFSSSKSHGGLFKEIIDAMDDLLYIVMKRGTD
jgi:hypothetical protein